jgi:hypothetical protein
MKISAKQIEKGMTIKVSNINDRTDFYTNAINGVVGYGTHSEQEKNYMKECILTGNVLYVTNGTINNSSPIVNVLGIQSGDSNGTYHNGKLFVNNEITLITDKGNMIISTRQKVELL